MMALMLHSGLPMIDIAAMNLQRQKAFEVLKTKQYSEILAHEQAHQAAAGAYGGGIVIDYDNNGVAVSGHVPIHIPALNIHHPESSLQAYQMIRHAALAPHSPSGQDFAIANLAQAQIGKAQVLIAKKFLAKN
jgi:hypothetical protein